MTYSVALDMTVVATQKFTDKNTPQFNYAALLKEYQVVRVMIFNEKELYGTISFQRDTNFGQVGQEQNQWVTLFDDPEDDLVDGDLGENDEDVPRIHITFKLVQPSLKASDPVP